MRILDSAPWAVLCVAAAACSPSGAQPVTEDVSPTATAVQEASSGADWTLEEVLPLSCLQVWDAYGDTPDAVTDIVITMADFSVRNRGLDFPQTEEAGMETGRAVLAGCAEDRDELLYSVVDRSVRRVTLVHRVVTEAGAEG